MKAGFCYNGLPENSITSINQDSEGNYWCAGINGLYRINRKNDKLRVYNVLLPGKYAEAQFTNMLFLSDSEIIFGTQAHGILIIKNNEIENFSTSEVLNDNHITALYATSDSVLWVGTQTG